MVHSLHNVIQEHDMWNSKTQSEVKRENVSIILTTLLLPQSSSLLKNYFEKTGRDSRLSLLLG